MHLFTQSFSSFLKTCLYHLNLSCCTTVIISFIPSLSQLITHEPVCYFNTTHPSNHSYLSPLKCQVANLFSFFTDHVSLSCNIQLCAQLLHKFHLIRSETSLLVTRDTSCLNLFHLFETQITMHKISSNTRHNPDHANFGVYCHAKAITMDLKGTLWPTFCHAYCSLTAKYSSNWLTSHRSTAVVPPIITIKGAAPNFWWWHGEIWSALW